MPSQKLSKIQELFLAFSWPVVTEMAESRTKAPGSPTMASLRSDGGGFQRTVTQDSKALSGPKGPRVCDAPASQVQGHTHLYYIFPPDLEIWKLVHCLRVWG